MYNSPMKNYAFSVFNHEDVKTKSWNLKEMGIAYYMVIDKISSHKTQYTFILTCSEDQWENYRTLMHLRRMRNDGTN